MTYTREQRAANAAKAAARAADAAPQPSPEPEAPTENNPNLTLAEPRPAYRNEARTNAFAEIEERHNRTSGNAVPPEEPAPEPKPAEPAKPVEPPQEPQPTEQDQTETSSVPPITPVAEMVTVKVDGEEFKVPKQDVEDAGGVRSYQTMRAADNRLKKVNETLAQTRQMQAYLAQIAQKSAPAPEAPKNLTAEEAFQAIRFGTPEEGWNILQTVVQQSVPKPIDPQVLMQSTMVETRKINAAEQFQKEFADIYSNPILYRTAVQMDRERMEEAWKAGRIGLSFDFPDHFRKIGNEIRGAFGRQSQPASTPQTIAGTPSQPSDKEARKASIVNLPSSSARAELPAEAKPETREETMNSYRKSRGQPTV